MALFAVTAMSIAPARTMPWIEFAADISGVCRVAGTLLMTSKPTHRASTKIVTSTSSAGYTGGPFCWICSRRRERRVHNLAAGSNDDPGLQLVLPVQRELAIGNQVEQQRADVARVHRGCCGRHRRGEGARADDHDAVLGHDCLARLRPRDIAAKLAGAHVDDDRPGRHGLERVLGDEQWWAATWHLCRGNHDIMAGNVAGQLLLLRLALVLGQRPGIAAFSGRRTNRRQLDEGRTDRLRL